MRKYIMAAVQMDTQYDKEANLKAACGFIDEAVARGAKFVAFPEVFNVIDEGAEPPEEIPSGRTTQLMAEKAREHNIWIHCGSIAEKNPDGDRKYNTTVVLDPKGNMVAKYRKLHTFDITKPDGTKAEESARIKPGSEMVTVDTEMGHLGLSICYDIRFPELYRWMCLQGAQILFTPANFLLQTGKDHWEPILRCRAIENGAYVVAPGEIGIKRKGQSTSYGNTMIIDPWGNVVARAPEYPSVVTAEIDLDFLEKIRANIPSLKNRRGDVYDTIKK